MAGADLESPTRTRRSRIKISCATSAGWHSFRRPMPARKAIAQSSRSDPCATDGERLVRSLLRALVALPLSGVESAALACCERLTNTGRRRCHRDWRYRRRAVGRVNSPALIVIVPSARSRVPSTCVGHCATARSGSSTARVLVGSMVSANLAICPACILGQVYSPVPEWDGACLTSMEHPLA